MAAQIDPDMTSDDMETEILFTRGALEAYPAGRTQASIGMSPSPYMSPSASTKNRDRSPSSM